MIRFLCHAARGTMLFAMLLGAAADAAAQRPAWPAKPITLVVPFPPGGSTDTAWRVFGKKLSESLGQAVIVENKPGAGGNVGAAAVAHAAPDGYTLVVGAAYLATSAHLYKKLSYDPIKDLTPVAMLGTSPVFLWVDSRLPARNLKELMALLKARPGHYNYSSPAPATLLHLGSLLLFDQANVQLVHINYKGTVQAMSDFLGGIYPIYFDVLQPVSPYLKSGKVRPLAVLADKRVAAMPDVPTTAEEGFPSTAVEPFNMLMAPSGTPATIVQQLNQAARQVLRAPEVRAQLERINFEVSDGGEPAALATRLRQESEKWGKVIRSKGLSVD
ncbi:tripartite tricarboxylate transporter substrate-binding protein [Cupriavidus sp. NPDC089707]|uniref:tripartite tricarboxylate transporter substrate-binding protein n=1 Tax=Cupriavidus sp. NPDC089707 TaxID=3363963 RepID=UPI003819A231